MEFDQELRKMCRHLQCRSRLPTPVSNPREAFCTFGCYRGFYRKRCLICEEPIQRTSEGKKFLCKKAKCRNTYNLLRKNDLSALGRYYPRIVESEAPKTIDFIGPKLAPEGDRWRQIAGPPLTASQFHCAAVGGSAMEIVKEVEARNRKALRMVRSPKRPRHPYWKPYRGGVVGPSHVLAVEIDGEDP